MAGVWNMEDAFWSVGIPMVGNTVCTSGNPADPKEGAAFDEHRWTDFCTPHDRNPCEEGAEHIYLCAPNA